MPAPSWNIRELVFLLNICNQRSLAVRSDGSLLAGLYLDISLRERMKLVLYHVHPIPFLPGVVGGGLQFPTIHLSDDVQQIWAFLFVRLQTLDHQFDRHEVVFDIVVKHRFFHISRMTQRLGLLQKRPADHPVEYQILNEFMTWWFRGDRVIRDSNISDYEEVIVLSLVFFRTHPNVFSEWETLCAQRVIESAQLQIRYVQLQINLAQRASASGISPTQFLQQQEQDNYSGAPYRDRLT